MLRLAVAQVFSMVDKSSKSVTCTVGFTKHKLQSACDHFINFSYRIKIFKTLSGFG